MSSFVTQPANVQPAKVGAKLASPASRLCLTGESGFQIQNIPVVVAAYLAFAAVGAFAWVVVNISWFMLIPVVGGLIASLVTVYFLHKQGERRRIVSVQLQQERQVMAVPTIAIEVIGELKSRSATKGE